MTSIWLATANPKKRNELDRLLGGLGFKIRTMDELPEPLDIVEDGVTFADNAAIKANVLASIVGEWAIGDDSGLCVDALDGRPGVLSARYAGPNANDAGRNAKLLSELADVERLRDRRAHFTCAVCLASPEDGVLALYERHCHGTIAKAPRGEHGFGYDPLFLPDEYADRDPAPSFAQLTPEQKDAISHRGHALRDLATFLRSATPTSL